MSESVLTGNEPYHTPVPVNTDIFSHTYTYTTVANDEELRRIDVVMQLLNGFDLETARRVLRYLMDRYGVL